MTMECPSCAAPIEAGAETCLACGRSPGTLSIGSVLANRYELSAILGKGGMGLVYRAFDRLLEEEVAIKVLRTDLSANSDAVRRFRTEIKLARKVSHPNVCRIHDYGEEGPLAYISMEILTGEDLHKALGAHPNGLPEAEALSAILQVASGLQAIHEVGILHRDLKTANVSRDERGMVRLVDFGIAKDLLSEEKTRAGESFGTPEYMSPEHCRGEALDFRSDIYALGIMAFELFTGDVPIRSTTPMATLFKQIQEMPSFDDERGLRVPRHFVAPIRRALAKAPNDRFATAQEFAQALRSAAIGESAAPPPKQPVPERSAEEVAAAFKDVRKDERIHLPTDVVLRKLSETGVPEKEERTVAHDLSRGGMRILTSWSDLAPGDKVGVAEVGGDFATGAIVRNVFRGTDHITRVGIEFLGNRAPDRLVGTASTQRPPLSPTRRTGPSRPAASSGPTSPAVASAPPPPPAPSMRFGSGTQPPVAPHRSTSFTPSPPRADRVSGKGPGAAFVGGAEGVQREVATARRLIDELKFSEALECLARAQALAQGTAEATAIRILVAETQAKIPDLSRSAMRDLEDLALAEPRDVTVQLALGRVFIEAGLRASARTALGRALVIDPLNNEAKEALAKLNEPGPWRR